MVDTRAPPDITLPDDGRISVRAARGNASARRVNPTHRGFAPRPNSVAAPWGEPLDDPPPIIEPRAWDEPDASPAPARATIPVAPAAFSPAGPRPVRRSFLAPGTPPPLADQRAFPPAARGTAVPPDPVAPEPLDPDAPWGRDLYRGEPRREARASPEEGVGETGEAILPANRDWRALGRAVGDWLRVRRRQIATGTAVMAVLVLVLGIAGLGPLGSLGKAIWTRPRPADTNLPAVAPPDNPTDRVAFYLPRAKGGNADAQLELAILYAKGDGVVQDYPTAATWFRAAAEQGLPRAQYDLGVLFERGRGVPVNLAEAFTWYSKAANANYPLAQYNLAVAYTRGQGTGQDFVAAVAWYNRAALQGVVPAMVNLAILYERGEGIDASAVDAYAWYRAAAGRGNQPAGKRADELREVLSTRDRPRAEARAAEIAALIRVPAGRSGPGSRSGIDTEPASGRDRVPSRP